MAQMAERDSSVLGHGRGTSISIHSQEPLQDYAASLGQRSEHENIDPFADPSVAGPALGGAAASGAVAAGAQNPQATPTPLYKKPWFILTIIVGQIIGIILLFILLWPLIHGIAQRIINVSHIGIDSAVITSPTNGSFDLSIKGLITNTGHVNADLTFREHVYVYWITGSLEHRNETELKLGYITLSPVKSRNARVNLEQKSTFVITNQTAMGDFTSALITSDSFTWRLKSESVKANALKFPVVNGLSFSRDLTVPGINSFNNHVVLTDFQLPADDPAGGIKFIATQTLTNPSPFDIELGTVAFDLYYLGTYLGRGFGSNIAIGALGPTSVTLEGTLIPHIGDQEALNNLGSLFSKYLSGESVPVQAKGVSTIQANGDEISWLSQGLKSLTIEVPLKSPEPINPIRSIDIGYLNLSFTPETSWAPLTSSNDVISQLFLPYGFSVGVSGISTQFDITQNGSSVAQLTTPEGAAVSDIHTYGQTNTSGPVNITLVQSPLVVGSDAHTLFSQFTSDLTNKPDDVFQIIGHAHAVANLSLGVVVLDPIKINVTSSLKGLNSLNTEPTIINSVDVLGGTSDHIDLGISVTLFNPSNLNLNTGDLNLALFSDGGNVGTVLLGNLSLAMGSNTVQASSAFKPNDSPQGANVLNQFVGQKDTELTISGFNESTQVQSLLKAFETLSIKTTLPGLNTSLLESAKLTVLNSTGYANNITHVTVQLNNPFTAPLAISYINTSVTAFGIPLGDIEQQTTFPAKGKAVTASPTLDLNLNMDPTSLFTVLRALAGEAGLETTQFDGIVKLGGYSYLPVYNVTTKQTTTYSLPSKRDGLEKRENIYTGFKLPPFVDSAFKLLKSEIHLTSSVNIGDYATSLTFTQDQVPVQTDDTLNMLLPILARPIVQKIVDEAVLAFDTLLITDPKEQSFNVKIAGAINQAGPFDAAISFPSGLTVEWNGAPIGNIAMPKVNIVGDQGATLDLTSAFTVADVGHLSDFTSALLTQESFNWTITGTGLSVNALGIDTGDITFSKTVSLKGFNGLKNNVVINSFDLPANDPAGGIHLTLNTTITNPSQVGIALDSIGFHNYFGQTYIGPANAGSAFALTPATTIQLPLAGRLIPQDGAQGLADVGQIFTNYVHGIDSNVTVNGDSAGGSNGPSWLNNGIKALSIPVSLPSPKDLQVINSITLQDLDLRFTEGTAWNPSGSSKSTLATFQLPFAFPLDVTALEPSITISYQGQYIAQLPIPKSATTTDVKARVIHLAFSDVPFNVFGDKHSNFATFLADTTSAQTERFSLVGAANTTASTAVGTIEIQKIGFNVDTSINGLQGLNARPTNVSDLDVYHGYPEYLQINVKTSLFNPSNITIGAGDVAFALVLQEKQLGVAIIPNAVIVPGLASYDTQVHFQPQGDAVPVGRILLQNYISGVDTVTNIQGNSATTPIGSLQPALSEIQLVATIPSIEANLIRSTSIVFPDDIVQTKLAQVTFVLANPFTASINLNKIFANATYQNRLNLAIIDTVAGDPIHADGHSNITSPTLPLQFNTNPMVIIELLEAQASVNRVDLGPLVPLFKLVTDDPNFKTDIVAKKSSGSSQCNSGNQFDVDAAILKSLVGLKVDLGVSSDLHLDDYPTSLSFTQGNVTTNTDESALNLIGAVAPPLVQKLVNNATLSFTSANISDVTDGGFSLSLVGSLIGTGPLDAFISFPEPLTVNYDGYDIATIELPPICATANSGVPDYRTNAKLAITDQNGFASFATFMLANPEFTWTISSPKVTVSALGYDFSNVILIKQVSFKGFNNLPGVVISNFELPGDDATPGLQIATDTRIPSPSNLGIDLGQTGFEAIFAGLQLGPLQADDLTLAPLSATVARLTGHILAEQGSAQQTLGTLFSGYVTGVNQTLQVRGDYANGAQDHAVGWLSTALKTLELSVILPGIDVNLVTAASIVFPTDIVESKIADATFTLDNPFGASISLETVFANATHHGIPLGIIDTTPSPAIYAGGHANITSPTVPLQFNTDPIYIIQLLASLAQEYHVDIGPLAELFQMVLSDPTYRPNITATPKANSTCNSGHQFDVDAAILAALKPLTADLAIKSEVKLDDIEAPLAFTQSNIPVHTDETALYLIGAVAPPIVQKLVDNATLSFSEANITDVTDGGFSLSLSGFLTGTGPLDANIIFTKDPIVAWQGKTIATIALPPICAAAYDGVPNYRTNAQLTITDQSGFTEFATYLLHNEEFTWTISTDDLEVDALDIAFSGVKLSKDVKFKAFNNLPGVTISNFQLPGDDETPGLQYSVDSRIPSPSNLGIILGTAGFQAFYSGTNLGPVLGTDFSLVPNAVTAEALVGHILQAQGSDLDNVGKLFSDFISGINSTLDIHGSYVDPQNNGHHTPWLSTAFETLVLTVTLEGTKVNLISAAHIEFPADIAKTGVALVNFNLDNPFGASIHLLSVFANATHNGLFLGLIDQEPLSNAIVAGGHANITSPNLPFEFDIDPAHIITLIGQLAAEQHVDLGPLPDLFKLILADPTFHPNVTATPINGSSSCNSGKQFDVNSAILASLKGLTTDLAIRSNVQLDDISAPLAFTQDNVPAITDESALYLITVVAPPIVQKLVDQAKISFTAANITNVKNDGFDLSLVGSVLNTGPLDALISFPTPVNVNWQGRDIATINLAPICAAANIGVPDYRTNAHLTITNEDAFVDFTTYILHNENFTWTISSTEVRVEALNIAFDGVDLTQEISFAAFNNLPGVTINNFNLPSDDPAGGITISTDSLIPSPSNLGIDLGNVGFTAVYKGLTLGPLTANDMFLAPKAVTSNHLTGRLVPQSGDDLNTVGDLFTNYLAGKNITLQVNGNHADGAQSDPVMWLTTAFKTLTLDVILPGNISQIIYAIDLVDLEVVLNDTDHTYSPLTSTKNTVATFRNPFGFSLQPLESAEDITLAMGGNDFATLKVPSQKVNGGVSTGNLASLGLTFQNIPLQSINNGVYQQFFAGATDTEGVNPQLKGTVDIVAKTAIGNVPIADIPFDVPSHITGINSFGGKVGISNLKITGSGGNGAYITAPLDVTLDNPSNITLFTNDVTFPTYYKGVELGRAVLDPLNLAPGPIVYPSVFHYQPANANDTVAQSFITQYLQSTDPIPLVIQGDAQSTPYESLSPALAGVKLAGAVPGIGVRLVQQINVYISLETLVTNYVTIDIDLYNPLDVDMVIKFLQNDSGYGGEIYATFDFPFDHYVIPAGGKANSGTITGVFLPKGAIATLDIIPFGVLDVFNAITVDIGSYEIPWLLYNQKSVPTNYQLDLLGLKKGTGKQGAQSLFSSQSASSVAVTESAASTASVASESFRSSLSSVLEVSASLASLSRVSVAATKTTESPQTGSAKPASSSVEPQDQGPASTPAPKSSPPESTPTPTPTPTA